MPEPLSQWSPRMKTRLLEELLYERVKVSVDRARLAALESELDASVKRVVADLERVPAARRDVRRMISEAWLRVGGDVADELSADAAD